MTPMLGVVSWNWTAIGTILLAVVTLLALLRNWNTGRQTKEALDVAKVQAKSFESLAASQEKTAAALKGQLDILSSTQWDAARPIVVPDYSRQSFIKIDSDGSAGYAEIAVRCHGDVVASFPLQHDALPVFHSVVRGKPLKGTGQLDKAVLTPGQEGVFHLPLLKDLPWTATASPGRPGPRARLRFEYANLVFRPDFFYKVEVLFAEGASDETDGVETKVILVPIDFKFLDI